MKKFELSDKKLRLATGLGLLGVVLVLVTLWIFDWRSGLLSTGCILGMTFLLIWLIRNRSEKLARLFVVDSSGEVKAQNRLLRNLPYPYAIVNQSGRIIWANQNFNQCCTVDVLRQRSLKTLFPELEEIEYPEQGRKTWHVSQGDKYFKLLLEKIPTELNIGIHEEGVLYALCLNDETESVKLSREMKQQRPVIGTAYLDNYEEIAGVMEDIRLSLVMAHIDRKVTKYFTSRGGICKKIDRDKYFLTIPEYHLDEMMEDHFHILDDVRETKAVNDQHITMSIGFGVGDGTYETRAEYSRAALDMALGRGGDQVAVKRGDEITYFGGSAKSVNRNTRVKARVKAHALKELLMKNDDVLIMGHRIPDFDAIGAATGVYRIVTALGKHAHIVLGEDAPPAIGPLRERLINANRPEMFINEAQAETHNSNNTLLIIVDTNRGCITEAPRLLEKFPNKVVIDHHRLSNDSIGKTVLSYVEPYASSTSEMVVELLQYMGDPIRIQQEEADAMYAGIVLDTNNFINRTGVRTFEAAAYLRRCGCDATRVKRMLFRDNLEESKAKAEAIHDMEVYLDRFALGICKTDELENPTVVCAQAANEMLNIKGVEASFVLTAVQDRIHISARSNDSVNVQIIMEKLGGGGHGTMAGAQIANCGIQEAYEYVKVTIQEMLDEGEI